MDETKICNKCNIKKETKYFIRILKDGREKVCVRCVDCRKKESDKLFIRKNGLMGELFNDIKRYSEDTEPEMVEYEHNGFSLLWNKKTNELIDPEDKEVMGKMVADEDGNLKPQMKEFGEKEEEEEEDELSSYDSYYGDKKENKRNPKTVSETKHIYENKCAISGNELSLDVAHISPGGWKDDDTIKNTFLVDKSLHCLFDKYVFSFNPDNPIESPDYDIFNIYEIKISPLYKNKKLAIDGHDYGRLLKINHYKIKEHWNHFQKIHFEKYR